MSLFPFIENETIDPSEVGALIKEYEIDIKTGKLTGRVVRGVDALAVWAYLALKSKRYNHIIYSYHYGEEYTNLIGYSYSEEYLKSEVERYITECLMVNENITGIKDLEINLVKDTLSMKFTLVTVVGSKEVEIDV